MDCEMVLLEGTVCALIYGLGLIGGGWGVENGKM